MAIKKNEYFIALTGRKKNVGDFLITERAINLLKHISPEYEYKILPHWEPFDDLDFINNSKGIIILGGPGYQMNMYPDTYKLTNNIDDIKVPIYLLGSGWYGRPGDKTSEKLYSFSKTAKIFLRNANSTYAGLSCRDYQTLRVLNRNGYNNVTMTGCPVWYDIKSLGKEFKMSSHIKKIVFTPAQREIYFPQNIEILDYLKKKYNDSEIIVSFHRGLGYSDEYTSESDANNTKKIAEYADKLGFKTVDVAFDLDKINFYDECDLHIGYRVHAHIYFLSKRLASILLHEDGRGNGVTDALKSPGINAYRVSGFYSTLFRMFFPNRYLAKIYGRFSLKLNEKIVDDLDRLLSDIKNNNYDVYKKTSELIDNHYRIMEEYIKKMIKGKGAL